MITPAQKCFLEAAAQKDLWHWREKLGAHWKTWESVWANGWVEQVNKLFDGCDFEYWSLTEAGRDALANTLAPPPEQEG